LASAVPFWVSIPSKVVTIEVHLTQAHLFREREREESEKERERDTYTYTHAHDGCPSFCLLYKFSILN